MFSWAPMIPHTYLLLHHYPLPNHNRTRLNKILTNSLPLVSHSKTNKLQGLGQPADSPGGTINSKLGVRHTNPVAEVVVAGILAVEEAGAVHRVRLHNRRDRVDSDIPCSRFKKASIRSQNVSCISLVSFIPVLIYTPTDSRQEKFQ